jgi:tRNA threonylcarbamoyladenosine biosynthesis protein TsaB
MVQDVLAQGDLDIVDLDAIVYGRGPGSFTGVRIAAGVAQGLAFALDIPVIPVSTLATMALQAHAIYSVTDAAYVCTLDARMNEIYVGTYQVDLQHEDLVLAMYEEAVLSPAAVKLPPLPLITCGSGLTNMDPVIISQAQHVLPQLVPKAEAMVRLGMANFIAGRMYAPEHALPVYLRDTVAGQKVPRYQ